MVILVDGLHGKHMCSRGDNFHSMERIVGPGDVGMYCREARFLARDAALQSPTTVDITGDVAGAEKQKETERQ